MQDDSTSAATQPSESETVIEQNAHGHSAEDSHPSAADAMRERLKQRVRRMYPISAGLFALTCASTWFAGANFMGFGQNGGVTYAVAVMSILLAHELGHGVHFHLAREQGIFHQTTPLTLAETAPVFGETVTSNRLLSMIDDPNERFALLASGIVALAILVLGPWLLLLWGPEFRPGYSVVLILTLGQVTQAAIGPVVLLHHRGVAGQVLLCHMRGVACFRESDGAPAGNGT